MDHNKHRSLSGHKHKNIKIYKLKATLFAKPQVLIIILPVGLFDIKALLVLPASQCSIIYRRGGGTAHMVLDNVRTTLLLQPYDNLFTTVKDKP